MKLFEYLVSIALNKEEQADFEKELKKLLSSYKSTYDFELFEEGS